MSGNRTRPDTPMSSFSLRAVLGQTLLGAVAVVPAPAAALCSGDTVRNEFRDATLIVRARVVAAENHHSDRPGSAYRRRWGEGGPVVRYRLRVEYRYKGMAPREITVFQERNSGAFYMDVGMKPDIGGTYLLYLTPIPPYRGRPEAVRGSWYLRHTCGQSKRWNEVVRADLAALRRISGRPG